MPTDKGKGKRKAVHPSERSPLLATSSRSIATDQHEDEPRRSSHSSRRARSIILTILIVLASLLISALLFLALLAYSFRPSPSELSALPKTSFKYTPPEEVKVLNVTEDGVLVNVTVRCGINADRAFGIERYDNDDEKAAASERGARGMGAEWWEDLRRWTARKALAQLPSRAVAVHVPEQILILPHHITSPPLLTVSIPSTLLVPLISDVSLSTLPDSTDWLQPISFTAIAKPLASTGQLWEFAQRVWAEGQARVVIEISKVEVELPAAGAWWGKYARREKEDLAMDIQMPVPRLPGLPSPGRPLNLSALVNLREYSFRTATSPRSLVISARATLPNFLPEFNTTLPFVMPFAISLPPDDKMAEVITEPIDFGGSADKIELRMTGEVTANLNDTDTVNSTSSLSKFLQNYLHGRDSPIVVRGLSVLPSLAPQSASPPPTWLLCTLPSLSLPLTFPGPRPPPKIIQSVTIERMRLSEARGKMRASGTVVAEVELPAGMEGVDLDVVAVMPDVLVFDGPAPDLDDDEEEIPAKAFGRIHPTEFLPSTTSPSGNPLHPHRLIVRAPLSNVPLDVLPGRDGVLSDFVSKVVFKGGAQAGIKGTASVRLKVVGVDGRVRLDDLPVRGEFWVGRERLLDLKPESD